MKTVLFKTIEINGVLINAVSGFDTPQIDPAATRKKIEPILLKSEISTEIKKIQSDINADKQKIKEGLIKINAALNVKRPNHGYIKKLIADKQLIESGWNESLLKIKPLAKKLIDKKNELMADPVYFTPGPGEIIITEDQSLEIRAAIRKLKPLFALGIVAEDIGNGYNITLTPFKMVKPKGE
jgi:hypothetical protein